MHTFLIFRIKIKILGLFLALSLGLSSQPGFAQSSSLDDEFLVEEGYLEKALTFYQNHRAKVLTVALVSVSAVCLGVTYYYLKLKPQALPTAVKLTSASQPKSYWQEQREERERNRELKKQKRQELTEKRKQEKIQHYQDLLAQADKYAEQGNPLGFYAARERAIGLGAELGKNKEEVLKEFKTSILKDNFDKKVSELEREHNFDRKDIMSFLDAHNLNPQQFGINLQDLIN